MLVSVINNSYAAFQTTSRWYWSARTQTSISNAINTLTEVLTTFYTVLSQCYCDTVKLIDTWLTLSCEPMVWVTEPTSSELDWWTVRAMLWGDLAYLQTWLSFTMSDMINAATEVYYRLRTLAR